MKPSSEKVEEIPKKSRSKEKKQKDKWDKLDMESSMNDPGLSLEEKLQTLQERVKEVNDSTKCDFIAILLYNRNIRTIFSTSKEKSICIHFFYFETHILIFTI